MSLEKAYKSRLAMLHDFIYQEPVLAREPAAKKKEVEKEAIYESVGQDLITSIVTRAKRLQKNVVEELIFYGVTVSEVAV